MYDFSWQVEKGPLNQETLMNTLNFQLSSSVFLPQWLKAASSIH